MSSGDPPSHIYISAFQQSTIFFYFTAWSSLIATTFLLAKSNIFLISPPHRLGVKPVPDGELTPSLQIELYLLFQGRLFPA